MTKKQYLELLIKSFGLIPEEIKNYRTDGCDGQFEIGIGWKGYGKTKSGDYIINFACPDGFNFAVYEILKQATENKIKPVMIFPDEK